LYKTASLPGSISRAEGWPAARLRIFGPTFMKFVPALNNVTTNYTNITIVNQVLFFKETL
jgi:hypothetical protein